MTKHAMLHNGWQEKKHDILFLQESKINQKKQTK
jgi:hypothetical protein